MGACLNPYKKGTPSIDSKKYIGMDVHKESISIAVMNGVGKIAMECVIETKASMILQFIDGLRGDLQVTFEEGTSAAWLYDLLKPHVTKLVVCDPRKNASMRDGNQSDKIARTPRLAAGCSAGSDHLNPVYHGEHGLRSLKELVRSYLHHHQRSRTGHDAGEGHLSAVGPFLVPASRSMHRAIEPSGSERSASRECAGGPSFTTNNSMRCGRYVRKYGGSCWRRARNTRPGNGSARFLRSVRFDQPYCWALCRLRTVSAPSGSCGRTAVLASRHKAAPITVVSRGSCNERRNRAPFCGLNHNCNHDLKNLFKGAAIRGFEQTRSVFRSSTPLC